MVGRPFVLAVSFPGERRRATEALQSGAFELVRTLTM